jgi:hypothetical protein
MANTGDTDNKNSEPSGLRTSQRDVKAGLGDWITVFLVGALAIVLLIASWLLVANAFRIGPP